MKGYIELKDNEGEVVYKCLFGVAAVTDFLTTNNIKFEDFEKELSGGDLAKLFVNIKKMIYHAAYNYAEYNDETFTDTERKVSLKIDVKGILAIEENIEAIKNALFSGFNVVEQKKTK